MLSEATFDQLVELPGVGPTRAQQFLQLREEAEGEVMGSWLCNIVGSRLEVDGRFTKNCFQG